MIGAVYDSSPNEITADPREQDVLRKLDAQAAELKRQHGSWAERAAVGHPRAEELPGRCSWPSTLSPRAWGWTGRRNPGSRAGRRRQLLVARR